MKTGEICYFKKMRTTAQKRPNEVTFKGVGVGLMLGHVAPKEEDMSVDEARQIMHSIGWVSFDDVLKILGKKNCAKLVSKIDAAL